MQAYRRDIDGLRAVAVLPVLLFHAGIPGFSGGFVGVDIFFVISGYLIAGIILREIGEGRFSLAKFYQRRARRILPAYLFVMGATFVASYFILFPEDFRDFGQSLVASALFVSNLLFVLESEMYFATATKPLLHTWSLSVEEQFYLLCPLFLLFVTRLRKSPAKALAAVVLASLALSIWASKTNPASAFFQLQYRAWELGMGALLAASHAPAITNRAGREALALVGLGLIVFAVTTFDETTAFPGMAALAPVLGTAAIIQAGKAGSPLVNRLLSLQLFVFIGLISYSLYLWHWPVFELYRYATDDFLSPLAIAGLIALVFALSVLSWLLIERPFRRWTPGRDPERAEWPTLRRAALALSGIAALGIGLGMSQGWWWRYPPEVKAMHEVARSVELDNCLATLEWTPEEPCVLGADGPVRTAVWGDSHALSLLPGIVEAADKAGERFVFYGFGGCPPLLGIERYSDKGHHCAAFNSESFDAILANEGIENVVIAARFSAYVEGENYGVSEYRLPRPVMVEAGKIAQGEQSATILRGLRLTLGKLNEAGLDIVVVYPIPEIGQDVPRRLGRMMMRGEPMESFVLPVSAFDARTRKANAVLDAGANGLDHVRIRPAELLCDETHCRVVQDDIPLYKDDDHLSDYGSRQLSRLFEPVFERDPAKLSRR